MPVKDQKEKRAELRRLKIPIPNGGIDVIGRAKQALLSDTHYKRF